MNIPLLTKVRDLIIEHGPEHFDMGSWVRRAYCNRPDVPILEDDGDVAICGTTMCIAGWTAVAAGEGKELGRYLASAWGYQHPQTVAEKALGLGMAESNVLFHQANWPEQYRGIPAYEGGIMFLNDLIEGKIEL